jgi:hypothetical protein
VRCEEGEDSSFVLQEWDREGAAGEAEDGAAIEEKGGVVETFADRDDGGSAILRKLGGDAR